MDCTVERPLQSAWGCIRPSIFPHHVSRLYVCLSLPIMSVDYTSVCLSPSCQWTICLSVSPHHVSGLSLESMRLPQPLCTPFHLSPPCQWTIHSSLSPHQCQWSISLSPLSPPCQWTIIRPSISPHHVSGLYVRLSVPTLSVGYTSILSLIHI